MNYPREVISVTRNQLKPYTNVRNQYAACGLWCGSCIVGNGTLYEMARGTRELVEAWGLPHWGPKNIDYNSLLKKLKGIEKIPICVGCRRGGGRDDCELRACVQAKKLYACEECDEQKSCRHRKLLNHMRQGAHRVRMHVNDRKCNRAKLMRKWQKSIKKEWPSSILFCQE